MTVMDYVNYGANGPNTYSMTFDNIEITVMSGSVILAITIKQTDPSLAQVFATSLTQAINGAGSAGAFLLQHRTTWPGAFESLLEGPTVAPDGAFSTYIGTSQGQPLRQCTGQYTVWYPYFDDAGYLELYISTIRFRLNFLTKKTFQRNLI